MEAASSAHVPLVRYGKYIRGIPGDKYARKTAHSGNVYSVEDPRRAAAFPRFDSDKEPTPVDEKWMTRTWDFLKGVKGSFVNGEYDHYIVEDTERDKTAILHQDGLAVRISLLKDVDYTDSKSYYNSIRATTLERKASAKMDRIEPPMGRAVENLLIAKVLRGEHQIASYRMSNERPSEPGRKRNRWYKKLRAETTRVFWLEHNRQARDDLRKAASRPPRDLQKVMDEVEADDDTWSRDFFYQHLRDRASAADPDIYTRVDEDVVVILDRNGEVVLVSFSRLFQRLFGDAMMQKVDLALRKWTTIAALPQPDSARHMVDELIRQKHPELNMELATTLQELEERASCVVHYGTWGMKGHGSRDVFLTADTKLEMAASARMRGDYSRKIFPQLKRGAFGISSEVARFVFSSVAPREYDECIEAFRGLAREDRMGVSAPNWATLCVLGINSFTERHVDKNDIKYGFASLIPLGDYKGGDLCFPQLGIKLDYQPGACVVFRGAELQHFVDDWTGYRIFLLFTNHQVVRDYSERRRGLTPALPTDPWYRGPAGEAGEHAGPTEHEDVNTEVGDSDDSDDSYDICVEKELDPEPEPDGRSWTDIEIHGPFTWDPEKNFNPLASSSSGSESVSGGGSSKAESAGRSAIYSDSVKRQKLD
ncbi:hypothetical protein DL770_008004 [Monosporascus sp. CRB-9-2]|nr:hypothetical protein DL770_008004 [Monosporascus sp. CRB-9-2]